MAPLSIMLWLPAAAGVLGALAGLAAGKARARTWLPGAVALAGALGAFGLWISYVASFKAGGGLQD
jgi:hypothetical protein